MNTELYNFSFWREFLPFVKNESEWGYQTLSLLNHFVLICLEHRPVLRSNRLPKEQSCRWRITTQKAHLVWSWRVSSLSLMSLSVLEWCRTTNLSQSGRSSVPPTPMKSKLQMIKWNQKIRKNIYKWLDNYKNISVQKLFESMLNVFVTFYKNGHHPQLKIQYFA